MTTGPIETQSQPGPQRRENAGAATRPSFLRAFRGLWLFTWRTQLSWGRLPIKALGLAVLPALIYLTTLTAQKWAERYSPLGNPGRQVSILSYRLQRAGVPLRPEQRIRLETAFTEEFARTEQDWRESETSQPGDLRQQIRECYTRIGNRLQTVLDDRQLSEFQDFKRQNLNLSERRTHELRWSWTAPFYHWLVDFYFFVMLPLACVRTSGAMIRDDLQADTLGFLLTRPLSRGRLLLLKYLAQTAWLQIVLLIETLLIFAAGALRHIPELGILLPLFIAVQFLAVCAWSGLGTMLGLISNRYIALALLYGLIVEMGIGRIPTNINNLSVMRHLKTLLAQNPVLQSSFEWSGSGAALSVGALVLATAIFVGIAFLLFTFIEYQHATEMQK